MSEKMDKFNELRTLIDELEPDYAKAVDNNNTSALKRARNLLQDIRSLCQELMLEDTLKGPTLELRNLINEFEPDYKEAIEKNNVNAGKRARHVLQNIRFLCIDLRKQIIDKRKALKD